MGKELPKEKKWGIRNCRERKCPELRKNENEAYPEDSQERCQVFNTMPGTLPCCIQDMDHLPPEEFLRHCTWQLHEPWEKKIPNRKTPGPKNCPAACPYKISEQGEVFGKTGEAQWKKKPGTIWKCAFTGGVLGQGLGASCPCHVLDNPDQEKQIDHLQRLVKERLEHYPDLGMCTHGICPDGIVRPAIADDNGERGCPVIRLPFSNMRVCPLWRIPAKLLAASAVVIPPESRHEPAAPVEVIPKEKSQKSTEKVLKKSSGKLAAVKSAYTTGKVVEEKKTRKKKEPEDPLCERCRTRNHGHVPDHACTWCKEEQEKKGRRAWTTPLQLGQVHCGDMEKLGEQIPDESVDLIFTDPPYVKDQYEEAYDKLAHLASRVLKPYGFLITYAPQTHLDEIMDFLRYSGQGDYYGTANLRYFWIISSLNEGKSTAKNHQRNAICLHKPILVFQKAQEEAPMKGSRRCFADVVRGLRQKKYHPWQQSIHDVLGIISRFMDPGEILLDPFAGWGTTLIAANLLGMEWVGFEIEPDRQKIAMQRLGQRPMDLFTFGGEMPEPVVREAIEAPKDTSRQASIEICSHVKTRKKTAVEPEPADPATEARAVELHAACLECEGREDCRTHDPRAGCLDTVKAIQQAQKDRDHCTGGGPQPVQEGCCGTCGHHRGRKSFHESCPRLDELVFKKGPKSAKVLMEETQREKCEHWISKAERIPNITWCSTIRNCPSLDWEGGICTTTGKKLTDQNYCPTQHLIGEQPKKEASIENDAEDENRCKDFNNCTHSDRDRCEAIHKTRKVKCLAPVRPKKDTPEWFAALTEEKRKNNPHWLWEVWKHDPAKGEWLYEGTETQTEAYALKERIEETRPEGSKVLFSVKKRPDPDYDPNDIEGPCKTCTIECLDDNDGCHEFDEHIEKLEEDGEPPGEWPDWPVCIISCGKAKIWDNPGKKKPRARVCAQDAYTGPLFTSAKNYAEKRHRGPWYILSDKYGLILPGEEIENYDVSPEDIKDDPEFFEAVHHRARADPDLSRAKKIVLIAGKIHQDIIERVFPGVEIFNPVQGLTQGERMHVLKNLTAESPAAEKPNCGGKRPALNRCPDSCPDRSCEKEGGYPQGRCKQTGQKLREMQTCPNDPPKKPVSKKSKKESETA